MISEAQNVCEIRVPTFRRPKLLKRALLSILAQTHSDWRCIVFDDCPDGSARDVTNSIHDERIVYSHNTKRLGAIGNIDQAFAHNQLLGGQYAFVLEDDNFLLPIHIEHSIKILKDQNIKVLLCNQFCEVIDVPGEPGRVGSGQTLNWMYDPGIHHPDELLLSLLFSHGFSNGSAFWSTDCLTDFQIGAATKFPEIQESLRLLQLRDAVYVSLDATSVWRPREPEQNPRRLTAQRILRAIPNRIRRLRANREAIEYRSEVMKRLGTGAVSNFMETNAGPSFARFKPGRAAGIESSMLLCGYDAKLTNRGRAYRLGKLAVGFAVRRLLPSDLRLADWPARPIEE
jgi:glycosyltransferase involved in cell wall biosynthesis